MSQSWYRWDKKDLILFLRVQPKASRNEFGEIVGDERKVRITAPPVDGKANLQLQKLLASEFSVNRSRIVIESGESARHKRIRVIGPDRLPEIINEPT